MQTSLPKGIFTSQLFRFVIGEAKTEFFLHSELVECKSKALGKLVNDASAEGQQGYIGFRDEDTRTFSAFADFIYTADYDIPYDLSPPHNGNNSNHRHKENCENQARQLEQPDKDKWGRPENGHWWNFRLHGEYRNIRRDCPYYLDLPPVGIPCFNTRSMTTDYSEFFIAHAKVFVFAEHYGVAELMGVSMKKLHVALCTFELSEERIEDILALVCFCYDQQGAERLKRMVASYSAAIMDVQVSRQVADGFQALIKERAEFAADMAWILTCRVLCRMH
ncbi:hypothetical protein E4U34_004234 [Claviceps purpurea]|nr:hypothetical protein E4U34_004234 [Claviceps purpurea]